MHVVNFGAHLEQLIESRFLARAAVTKEVILEDWFKSCS